MSFKSDANDQHDKEGLQAYVGQIQPKHNLKFSNNY